MYFRSGYTEGITRYPRWDQSGEWSAYIIEPSDRGYALVLHSAKGERDTQHKERVRVAFTRVEDAGKFIIAAIGNSIRVKTGLDSVVAQWRDREVDTRIQRAKTTPEQLSFMLDVCVGIQPGFLEKHLEQFYLQELPSIYALPLPSEVSLMNILPLTYDQLDELLARGLPNAAHDN